ncbi:3-hydroxybutyrate dehydrogenase [Streptantibioticus silvisoli]|uniref:3-hydroxybutyrate dehydrogenase n=1 Tax=Streptantibioticus silvisoli TaxID=2705255 RepID=A0ABT6VVV9_9ACTN|nr:3-hydroxybutyrate dehydrogenase [Streptantibioticus silvisoli]MDI5962626.1 3-hydroxybutyrate dehydrogenase [Streptantibioticus silvisoli]
MDITDSAASGSLTAGRFLTGRTALVTGAASGIGRACAIALAAAGAAVEVVDRDAVGARAVAALTGGTAHVVDLSDGATIGTLPDDADIVVNNAGIQHVAPIQDFPPETFALIQRIMVEAPFRILRHTLPGMYARGWGRVVNISSVHGLRASAYKSAYVTAKHALEGLSKVTALEGAPHGVTSNCVCPGYVRTPLVEGQLADQAAAHGIPESQVLDAVLLERTAVKRLVTPEEVAEAVLWLCTPFSASVSGTSLTLDGGWTAG